MFALSSSELKMIATPHHKIIELVQHTQTLKTSIQKSVGNPKAWNHIELSRLYQRIAFAANRGNGANEVTQTLNKAEFANLFSMTIILLYTQTAFFMRGQSKNEEDIWFLTTLYLRESKHLITKNESRPSHTNTNLFITLLEALHAVSIPPELAHCIIEISQFYHSSPGKKGALNYHGMLPVYEEYLNLFAPDLKRTHGIFFTPPEAVSFIVRSLHVLLSSHLNKHGGLANPHIAILDPSAGPGTFFTTAAQLAVAEYVKENGPIPVSHFINDVILVNHYSTEKIFPLWALSFLNLSHLLRDLNVSQNRLYSHFYLEDAFELKSNKPFTVILGNPPYALQPSYTKNWITAEVKKYGHMLPMGGVPVVERNSKWLLADYVKFIRFAQLQIEKNGEGVVGFIVNNGFLENPTFRGMRLSLLETFNEIYILDLHGNMKKPEKTRDTRKTRDENLFDINQGIAIVFFIKKKEHDIQTKVYYSSLLGTQSDKKKFLKVNGIDTIHWQQISPVPDFYLFTPHGVSQHMDVGDTPYREFYKITDIFPVHGVGIVTGRDKLTLRQSADEMIATTRHFLSLGEEAARKYYNLGKDSRDWSITMAQKDIIASGPDASKVVPILYRPFDLRYTYYTGKSRGFLCMPRMEVMHHMFRENIALITVRQVAEGVFSHNFVTDTISESRITTSNRGICYHFPLYLYSEPNNESPMSGQTAVKISNLNPIIAEKLRFQMGLKTVPSGETLFYYVYAVLSSPEYRTRYAEELKMDFPRIPFPFLAEVFVGLCELGKQLVQIHLLKSPQLNELFSQYIGSSHGGVKLKGYEKTRPQGDRLYINDRDYFTGITGALWDYHMCGYPILYKTLKTKNNQKIDKKSCDHFIKVVRAVQLTMEYEKMIDTLYRRIEEVCSQSKLGMHEEYQRPEFGVETFRPALFLAQDSF